MRLQLRRTSQAFPVLQPKQLFIGSHGSAGRPRYARARRSQGFALQFRAPSRSDTWRGSSTHCRYSVISREVVYMSLRSLFSSLRYRRSQHEYLDGAGLIIAARLKDLLASDNGQLHTVAQPTPDVCASENKHPVEIDTKNSTSSAVKTAA